VAQAYYEVSTTDLRPELPRITAPTLVLGSCIALKGRVTREEERLAPARFFRASRQHLIHLDFVEGMEPGPSGTLIARLRGGREVELSRRQSQRLRELLGA
jgi:hypothetical protein